MQCEQCECLQQQVTQLNTDHAMMEEEHVQERAELAANQQP